FTGANAVTFVVYGGLGGALFLLPIELQQVAHYSPLRAGIALLPITVITLALSARSGALAARIGPRLQMSVGPLLVGAGLALLVVLMVRNPVRRPERAEPGRWHCAVDGPPLSGAASVTPERLGASPG